MRINRGRWRAIGVDLRARKGAGAETEREEAGKCLAVAEGGHRSGGEIGRCMAGVPGIARWLREWSVEFEELRRTFLAGILNETF
jgi:hypothetical protein